MSHEKRDGDWGEVAIPDGVTTQDETWFLAPSLVRHLREGEKTRRLNLWLLLALLAVCSTAAIFAGLDYREGVSLRDQYEKHGGR